MLSISLRNWRTPARGERRQLGQPELVRGGGGNLGEEERGNTWTSVLFSRWHVRQACVRLEQISWSNCCFCRRDRRQETISSLVCSWCSQLCLANWHKHVTNAQMWLQQRCQLFSYLIQESSYQKRTQFFLLLFFSSWKDDAYCSLSRTEKYLKISLLFKRCPRKFCQIRRQLEGIK